MNIFTIFFLQNCSKIHSNISANNYTLKHTKLHHLKRVSRECMPHEYLANAEILSNLYSKRAIL